MDYQVVAVTLRDRRVIEDVAVVHHSVIAAVRGHTDIPFDPADITHIEVTHRQCTLLHPLGMASALSSAAAHLFSLDDYGRATPRQTPVRQRGCAVHWLQLFNAAYSRKLREANFLLSLVARKCPVWVNASDRHYSSLLPARRFSIGCTLQQPGTVQCSGLPDCSDRSC
jgi:hypothetical protein